MVLEKKSSARVEAGQRRVLDEATRQRRLSRQLEALEKDNFQDDPLSSLPPAGPAARLPAFSEMEEPEKKRRKTRGDHFKQRFRKNFTTLLEEEVTLPASSSSSSGVSVSSFCALIGRTCQRKWSLTTCLQWPLPPPCLPVISAACVDSLHTTLVPPVGGATAAAGVCAHTERPGV